MSTSSNRIVLIGAANRVELADHLLEAAQKFGLKLSLTSVEASSLAPIGTRSTVVQTNLSYQSQEFTSFLVENFSLAGEIVLPLMDSSIESIYRASSDINTPVTKASVEVLDKKFLKSACTNIGVDIPKDVNSGTAHVRPIFGNGSKDLSIVDLDVSETATNRDVFLYEEILEGEEVSLDTYVFQDGSYSAIARDRLRVVGGEVQHTKTRDLNNLEQRYLDALLMEFPLRGPINVQFMGPDCKLLEINPRFGGGSTASIKAGWLANEWLLQEYCLGNVMTSPNNKFRHVEVKRAWKDYVWR